MEVVHPVGAPVLAGLKVLDISQGKAAPMAGMILADLGALVLKIEPPGGDWARSERGFPMWNRGKHSHVVDLDDPAGVAELGSLTLDADVVLLGPEVLHHEALQPSTLRAAHPALIVATISAFPTPSRFDSLSSHEALIQAASGRFVGNDALSGAHGDHPEPIFLAAPVASYSAAVLTVQAVVNALLSRRSTGEGAHAQTSLLDGLSAATMRLAFERRDGQLLPIANREGAASLVYRGIVLCFMTAECSDGRYIQMCARQPHHFQGWLRALDLSHLLDDVRFSSAPLGLQTSDDLDHLEAMIRQRMLTRSQDDWMNIFIDFDVGADPFLTFDEFLDHPQMTENGRVLVLEDPERGRIKQPGNLVAMSHNPSTATSSAPELSTTSSGAQLFRSSAPWPRTPPGARAGKRGLPLAGKTVLELAYYLAGPLGATICAEMGARVIKVEPMAGDPFRSSGVEFVHIGVGKESICIDLKDPRGGAILHELVKRSDALVHNFRKGVPERLGFGVDEVRRLNPRLAYVNAASYGSMGPLSERPAFHSTPNALSGGGILQAGEGNPPVDDSYPDPCAGVAVGLAISLGILASDLTGIGQYIETTMLAATAYVHGEHLTFYEKAPELRGVDSQQRGLGALYRLYQTSDGWIFVAAVREAEWNDLAVGLGHRPLSRDTRFSTASSRRSHDSELAAILAAKFAEKTTAEWSTMFEEHRLSAVALPYGNMERYLVDHGLVGVGQHPSFGSYYALPARVRFPEAAVVSRRRPPAAGEQCWSLLVELGFEPQDIAELSQSGVVGSLEPAEKV